MSYPVFPYLKEMSAYDYYDLPRNIKGCLRKNCQIKGNNKGKII